MIRLERPGRAFDVTAAGPLHLSADVTLDPSSLLVDGDRLVPVDVARFVRQLGPDARRLLTAKAESDDGLRAWNGFLRQQSEQARRAVLAEGLATIRATPGVLAAWERWWARESEQPPRLALPRRETAPSNAFDGGAPSPPRLPASAILGALRRAWHAQHGAHSRLGLRAEDALLSAGALECRAHVAGRLRADAPKPMPAYRRGEWAVSVEAVAPDTRWTCRLAPSDESSDALCQIAAACRAFYGARLRSWCERLQIDADGAPGSPLAAWVGWSRAALAAVESSEAVMLVQVGSHVGAPVQVHHGHQGSEDRIQVAFERIDGKRAEVVASARPFGWLMLQPIGAPAATDVDRVRSSP